MVKLIFCLCSFILPAIAIAQSRVDTISVYFDIGISALKPAEQYKIDSLLYYETIRPGKKLGIIGYADYLGSEESNIGLSEKRANGIKAYLLGMGMDEKDIQLVIGKGEVQRNAHNGLAGYQEDRRVDIIPGGFIKPSMPLPPVKTPPIKTIDLATVKKNETIRLERIHFVGGSHQWLESSIPALRQLLEALKQHPNVKVRIEGHVCCVEPGAFDGLDIETGEYKLSENRAKAVYDFLVRNGIDATRLEHTGFGRSRPIADPERSAEDRTLNRRVEIRIIGK